MAGWCCDVLVMSAVCRWRSTRCGFGPAQHVLTHSVAGCAKMFANDQERGGGSRRLSLRGYRSPECRESDVVELEPWRARPVGEVHLDVHMRRAVSAGRVILHANLHDARTRCHVQPQARLSPRLPGRAAATGYDRAAALP